MSIKDRRGSLTTVTNLIVYRNRYGGVESEGSVRMLKYTYKVGFLPLSLLQQAAANSIILTGPGAVTKVPRKDAAPLGYCGKYIEPKADLRGVDLRDLDLIREDLRGADLRGADLFRANIQEADLRDAKLQNANLGGTLLHEADLRGANLQGANLSLSTLLRANLREADFREARLFRADLRGADLRGADLRGADLSLAKLRNSYLEETKLLGAKYNSETQADIDLSERGAVYVD